MDKQDIEIALTDASSKYVDSYKMRALVSAIPMIGGALDQLFSGVGAKWQAERIDQCLNELNARLEGIEGSVQVFTEDFYDLSISAFEGVVKTKSAEKIKRFANILANKVLEEESDWDDAQLAVSILSSLEEVHFAILHYSKINTHFLVNHHSPIYASLNRYKAEIVRAACFQLLVNGLLQEEPVTTGRYIGEQPERYKLSTSGEWFLGWISEQV